MSIVSILRHEADYIRHVAIVDTQGQTKEDLCQSAVRINEAATLLKMRDEDPHVVKVDKRALTILVQTVESLGRELSQDQWEALCAAHVCMGLQR